MSLLSAVREMRKSAKCGWLKGVAGGVAVLGVLAVVVCIIQSNDSTFKMNNTEQQAGRKRRSAENLDSVTMSPGGAVYTRWGRTTCPKEADLVYKGAAGGSMYSTAGGAAEYLCLPDEPLWGVFTTGAKLGNIYGTEYQSPTSFSMENSHGQSAYNHNVPCAVCISKTRVSTVMIPARNLCYPGWSKEYSGYLMTERHANPGRTRYVCVDGSPEIDPAGYRAEGGALMWNVEAVCGSLKCPPYIPQRELTCVVCTK